jgi:tetratricopeptide (TPR) repeat protein
MVCEFIEAEWGEQALVQMLREYLAGKNTDQVFAAVLKLSPKDFDQRFEARVRKEFGPAIVGLAEPAPPGLERLGAADLLTVARSRPQSLRTQFAVGVRLARLGEGDEAIAALERARALFPQSGDADGPLPLLAQLYEAEGEMAKAIDARRALVLRSESDLDAHVQLARLALMAHDTATAIDALDRSMYINPLDLDRHKQLAALASARGAWGLALRERRAIVAMTPVDLAGAWYDLAWAQFKSGDATQAKRSVLRALEEAPSYLAAQELLLTIVDGGKP